MKGSSRNPLLSDWQLLVRIKPRTAHKDTHSVIINHKMIQKQAQISQVYTCGTDLGSFF